MFIQQLPAGFATSPHGSTESTVILVVEGEVESRIGG
jgi:gentisate 1,2-dioxygenase